MFEINEENKKKLLFFIGIAVIIIFFIIFYFVFFRKKIPQLSPSPTPSPIPTPNEERCYYIPSNESICSQKKTLKEKEKCFDEIKLRNILKKENLKECLSLKTVEKRDDCLKTLIAYHLSGYQRSNNDRLCLAISDVKKRKMCLDRITITLQDPKLCKKYFKDEPFERKECEDRIKAFQIGEDEKNKENIYKCTELKTLEYPRLCLLKSFKWKFKDDCTKVPSQFRDYCIAYYTTLKAKSFDDCNLISLPDYKKFCIEKVKAGKDWRKVGKLDSDNDGIPDWNDLFMGLDPYNPDTDGDGLLDGEEFSFDTNPSEKDTDHDGLTDYEEVKIYQTNPANPDTDDDGILDGEEIKKGTNPVDGDKDKDGLPDELEKKIGTYSTVPDSDNDGYKDGWEWERGYDPLKKGLVLADTDKDGLLDVDEIFYGTDRLNPDTDGDGVSDKKEVEELTNPLGEGDMDFDGDGLTDKEEAKYGTNPSLPDTDGDGISDFEEVKGKK